jgi:hypothetical protein
MRYQVARLKAHQPPGDSFLVGGGMNDGDATTETIVTQTDPVVLDTNEVYLKVKTDNCLPTLEEQATYEIELTVAAN